MWVDNVNFCPIQPKSGLIGFASVDLFLTQEQSLHLGNIAVYRYKNKAGYRVTYPTRKTGGSSFPIFKPNDHKLADKIKAAVLCRVIKVMEESHADND